MKNNLPLVSVIVPVLNGEKMISRNLKSIFNQTYPNFEVIVVDNYSTDKTREIAQSLGATVYLCGPERVFQDNFGAQKAKGKYIFITGCDMVLDKNYLEEAVKLCEEKKYDAVYAHVVSETHGYWSKVKGLERQCYLGDKFHEAARFFNRKIFLKLGGFRTDMKLHGDDYEMQKKLDENGYKTGNIKSVETHVDEIDSLKTVFLKSFYYGFNSKKYIEENPNYALSQLSPVRGAFFKNWKLFVTHPLLTIGFVIFKLVQYSSATSGLILAYAGGDKIAEKFHQAIYKKRT